eukprot:4053561-Pyramimonas_sp.AAC.1
MVSSLSSSSSGTSGDLEPWHEWVRRATRYAMQQMEAMGYQDWVTMRQCNVGTSGTWRSKLLSRTDTTG